MKRNGFTFVELLVVMTIAGIIFAISTVTYTNVTKSSRDARRKADMESIRQALELCRSFVGTYPAPVIGHVPEPLTCGTQTYMTTIPRDPKSTTTHYTYTRPTTTTYTLSSSLMESQSNPYTVTNP
ncbi:MAG: Type II secretion system protein G [Candidatus Collierbacteria bacterium GW2011_GWC1_45_47]|uniref:Type II secretion system protein G n=5 Tax=Candidatus Collieribacteriota TaxID=1752725 RepID=A0A0G1KH53_9BACT|nr:MAG: Type II secretion system protein G [Candidatus Collierbacteria bacterium GW2011_GWA1_44_12]KKT39257.1 MAG: Type II secretion system protein G [Candidatus Collierbacteria bacterium GW2011_GWF1_44_12]KKT47189.1 MAG: Type II secretion system protein G [Candidatus Collierbacteria bacterium GW2011_GWF2_44_15]KKT99439.1 MAG: Type II secretion system protein G [Candidatus Collierbacteria bacterium GW2011_GWC2_45_15]KKU08924.1 MAG: Type II secretion system protein G [Candidatus Collierbacteria 